MDWQAFRKRKAELGRPFMMAHRGASALLPENSLAAFARALADGADILETDLRFSKEGEIVLMHDETVDRTTTGSGPVRDLSLAEFKRLTVRHAGGVSRVNEAPPTLQSLIDLTGAQVPLALELKDLLFAQPQYGQKLARCLHDCHMLDKVILVSFDLSRLQTMKALEPALATGWITLSNPLPNHPVEFLGPFWPLLLLNPLYAAGARRSGKIICPLDPRPEPRLRLYLKLGLDALLTNDPATTLAALSQKP
jgi:glycerophosphoryl diester phosphodiesterase